MKLEHDFTVPLPPADAWAFLTDLEQVAPCMPGATLLGVDDGTYRGSVSMKVGPISAVYEGTASFVHADEARRHAVLEATGRDRRGQGRAAATVTATLSEEGASTAVHLETDLAISGKVAQFGRGVMADVSTKLMAQFAENLERQVATSGPIGQDTARTATEAESAAPAKPVDLLALAGGSPLRRFAPVIVAAVGAFLLLRGCGS